jgi:hypothetical protein
VHARRRLAMLAGAGLVGAPAWAAADGASALPTYLFASLAALVLGLLVVYVGLRAYEWFKSAHRAAEAPAWEIAAPAEPSGPFDFRLLDVVHLPPKIALYCLKLGDRLLLLAASEGQLVSLGDFPLSWATAGPGEGSWEARGYGPRPAEQPAPRPTPRPRPPERDEEAWRQRREALIRALQAEGE